MRHASRRSPHGGVVDVAAEHQGAVKHSRLFRCRLESVLERLMGGLLYHVPVPARHASTPLRRGDPSRQPYAHLSVQPPGATASGCASRRELFDIPSSFPRHHYTTRTTRLSSGWYSRH